MLHNAQTLLSFQRILSKWVIIHRILVNACLEPDQEVLIAGFPALWLSQEGFMQARFPAHAYSAYSGGLQ